MGQREGIIVWLVGGGIMLPVIVLVALGGWLGGAAFPVALMAVISGIAFLSLAKWRPIRSGEWLGFGSRQMTVRERRFYWTGYDLIASGLVLAFTTFRFH